MDDYKYYQSLDWPDKKKIQNIQMDLTEKGYAKDAQFVQLECRKEAIRIFKEQQKKK